MLRSVNGSFRAVLLSIRAGPAATSLGLRRDAMQPLTLLRLLLKSSQKCTSAWAQVELRLNLRLLKQSLIPIPVKPTIPPWRPRARRRRRPPSILFPNRMICRMGPRLWSTELILLCSILIEQRALCPSTRKRFAVTQMSKWLTQTTTRCLTYALHWTIFKGTLQPSSRSSHHTRTR